MSWKRTILAGCVLVLAVLLYQADLRITSSRVIQAVIESSLAPGINLSEVVSIDLTNRHGTAALERENGQWRLKSPLGAAADPELVNQLLVNVTAARKRNEIEVKNLAEYGLAQPEVTLKLRTESGKTFDLNLGHDSTYTGQVFAAYPGGRQVFTVGQHVQSVLRREPIEFRYARLFDIDTARIEENNSIRISSEGQTTALKKEGSTWRIVEPVQAPAENALLTDYLQKVGMLRATDFIDEQSSGPVNLAAALQALTSPTLTVAIGPPTGQSLIVAKVDAAGRDQYVAQRDGKGQVLLLRPETMEALREDFNTLRSRTIFALKPSEVGFFSVEIGRGRTDLIRGENGKWQFIGDPARRVDQEQVENRLDSLLRSRVKQYVDSTPTDYNIYDLGTPPRFRFTLQSKDKQQTEILEAGRSEPNAPSSVYARRGNDTAVFTMDLSREIIISDDLVADKNFLASDPRVVATVEIALDGSTYTLQQNDRVWQILKPGQSTFAPASGPKAERVLAVLNSVQYSRDYTAEGQTVIAPTEESPLVVHIRGRDGQELAGMTVSRRMPSSSIVTASDGRTYEVENQALDLLQGAVRSLIQ